MRKILAHAQESLGCAIACAVLAGSQTFAADIGQGVHSTVEVIPSGGVRESAAKNPEKATAPMRKAGWWEFFSGSGSEKSTDSNYLCVGPTSESKYSAFDQIIDATSLGGGECSKREFVQKEGSWSFDLACQTSIPAAFGGGASTNKGTITGSFQSNYVIHQTITMSGASITGTVSAVWKGACPADRKEGDKVVSGVAHSVLH